MKHSGRHSQTSPPTRWLVWLCLALLLAVQGWGQIHRIAHALPDVHVVATEAGEHHHWGHAAGSVDCQVLDHLGHADGLVPTFALPLAACFQGMPAGPRASCAALVERWSHSARAPPFHG